MISLAKIFEFNDPFIYSASGLAFRDNHYFVVSDDELTLLKLDSHFQNAGVIKLFKGDLPSEEKERKKLKPDFESLVYLQHRDALLCMPSGSTANRMRGAMVENNHISELSFKNVYSILMTHFSELNIEGACEIGPNIRLFQRGNGKLHQNGLIDLNLESFLLDEIRDLKIQHINLGRFKNVPLTFTDACFDQGVCWFLAVAENTESTYDDGEFVGAVLGKMDKAGIILSTQELNIPYKPEGLFIKDNMIYVVTDADNRSIPSAIYRAQLS